METKACVCLKKGLSCAGGGLLPRALPTRKLHCEYTIEDLQYMREECGNESLCVTDEETLMCW